MVRKKDRYVPVMFVFKEEIPFTRPYEIDFLVYNAFFFFSKLITPHTDHFVRYLYLNYKTIGYYNAIQI